MEVDVGPLAPGEMKLVEVGAVTVGVYNCGGRLSAFAAVETYPVSVRNDGVAVLEVPDA